MDIRKIKKLIALIEKTNISEIKLREGDTSLKICRSEIFDNNFSIKNNYFKQNQNQEKSFYNKKNTYIQQSKKQNVHVIRSPMVGVFYRAPSPTESPFVEIGQNIKVGDTICIIEAMKMMNQIQSDCNGTVISIFLEDGQSVEFDEPLITIETNK
ncbi:acetyl CoA carboxylase, BCCP subunit [Wigglesworthia glossinidia endosymbiont of Glossina morsitans morsitans (Yale colony)]|uniref:Biotin carboxyl carrier protein of acetyl-CoA carboxylase n=1 Tax=Wigglesworthia glossinidia endosymbiont of Glossina morsitans morsitans (Yale colony) TaxID=1142511 RepID=H6Q4D2_WIGGL|nr:acetyl-CoA carboxylase biotin carboxyl carrier protein [Wigglesworthia glossinidia]AFA40992.1 acetyl CoA carboxylase, BCCP subunit [Wigglesworthia glossinidia endosymbiont of Glossina morsitans morsitans (Yale colony)]